MTLVHRMTRIFYNESEKTSVAQLRDDFGAYPPTPLAAGATDDPFKVVSVRGPGMFYAQIRMFRECWSMPDSAFATGGQSSELAQAKVAILHARAVVNKLYTDYGHLRIMRGLMAVGLVLTAIAYWLKSRKERRAIRGYFTSMPGLAAQVTVAASPGKTGITPDAVLSHEHIHLLQHQHGASGSRHFRAQSDLIQEKWTASAATAYLLKDAEVEARLHEVVLSSYRAMPALPLVLDDFLAMLCGCSMTGWVYQAALEDNGVMAPVAPSEWTPRNDRIIAQLAATVLRIKEGPMRFRFVTEVLPVMYGNLLKYYGDTQASDEFLRRLPRPNLYDKIYGESA